MRVALGTIQVGDMAREALGARIGTKLATREQARRFVLDNGLLALDDLVEEFRERREDGER